MTVMELIARIGIKADVKPADDLLKTVKGLRIGFGVATIAAGALVAGINKIVKSATAASRELAQFSRETGLSTTEMQKWQAVADQVSGSGNQVAASLKAITDNQAALRLGNGNISAYQLLGIDPRQDPFEILEQLRIKTRGLSQSMKVELLSQMGISSELIGVLELTNEQFDELSSRAWIIPPEQIESTEKARATMARLGNQTKYLKSQFTAALAPALEKFVSIITNFATATSNAFKMIDRIVDSTIGWKNALIGIGGVIAALNLPLLTSPLTWIAAAILGIILLLDDIAGYQDGKDSLIGYLIDTYPAFSEFIESLKDGYSTLQDLMNGDWSGLQTLIDKFGAWGVVLSGVAASIKIIHDSLKWIVDFFFTGDNSEWEKTEEAQKMIEAGNNDPRVNKYRQWYGPDGDREQSTPVSGFDAIAARYGKKPEGGMPLKEAKKAVTNYLNPMRPVKSIDTLIQDSASVAIPASVTTNSSPINQTVNVTTSINSNAPVDGALADSIGSKVENGARRGTSMALENAAIMGVTNI